VNARSADAATHRGKVTLASLALSNCRVGGWALKSRRSGFVLARFAVTCWRQTVVLRRLTHDDYMTWSPPAHRNRRHLRRRWSRAGRWHAWGPLCVHCHRLHRGAPRTMDRTTIAPRRAIHPARGRLFVSHLVVNHRRGALCCVPSSAFRAEEHLELTSRRPGRF
jgi:hypothetical protein